MTADQLYSLLQTVALVGGFFYFAGQLRADTRALKVAVADHEERIRGVEIKVH